MVRTPCCFMLALLLTSHFAPAAWASCGLEFCPQAHKGPTEVDQLLLLEASFKQVEFDIDDISGHYAQFLARLEYTGLNRWILGGHLPVVSLRAEGEEHTGLGNPVLFLERRLILEPTQMFTMGLQYEIPTGDDEHGIASDHHELLPYLSARRSLAKTSALFGNLGLRVALDGGHEHADDDGEHEHEDAGRLRKAHEDAGGPEASPLLVNPHADQELLWRVGATGTWSPLGLKPALFLEGQHPLGGDESGETFLSTGAFLGIPLGRHYQLNPLVEIPLTSNRRYDWGVSAGVTARF